MNRACAYCGAHFLDGLPVTMRRKRAPSELLKWSVFVAAVAFPIVGLIPGLAYMHDADPAHRAAARLWLVAGLCSSLIYVLAFLM
jgi:hypothetical protein